MTQGLKVGQRDSYSDALEELRQHPLRWGLVRTYAAQGTASSTCHRLKLSYRDFEFVTRTQKNGEAGIYGRYMGNGSAS